MEKNISEVFSEAFFDYMKVECAEKSVSIIVPAFFCGDDLKLTFCRKGDNLYISDNGCALNHLANVLNDRQQALKLFEHCINSFDVTNGAVTNTCNGGRRFSNYISNLVFLANADLLWERLSGKIDLFECDDYCYVDESHGDNIDSDELLSFLKGFFNFTCEGEGKVMFRPVVRYPSSERNAYFLIETADGNFTVSDGAKDKVEGNIFETLRWIHDDITPFTDLIRHFAGRFDVKFEDKTLYIDGDEDNCILTLLKFVSCAFVLSQLGFHLDLQDDRNRMN